MHIPIFLIPFHETVQFSPKSIAGKKDHILSNKIPTWFTSILNPSVYLITPLSQNQILDNN